MENPSKIKFLSFVRHGCVRQSNCTEEELYSKIAVLKGRRSHRQTHLCFIQFAVVFFSYL